MRGLGAGPDRLQQCRRFRCLRVATVRMMGGLCAVLAQAQHALNLALHPLGSGLVRLVDHEDVRDLHDAGLDGLHIVAHAGHQHDHGHLRHARDLDFILAHAHRFDDDEISARRIQQLAP